MQAIPRLTALATSAVIGFTGMARAETELLFSTFFPKMHTLVADVLEPWAEEVKKQTGGEVVINFAASSLAPPAEQLDMVQNGVADISVQFAAVVPNRLGAYQIALIPGPVASAEAMSVAMWRTHEKYFADTLDSKRLHILAAFTFVRQGMYSLDDTPLRSIEDIKGAKIATTPGIPATAFGSLSSGIVAVPAFRYFELVSKGMVDSYVSVTPLDVMGFNLSNYTKVATDMGSVGTAGPFVLVINAKKWNSLTDEQRATIESLSGEAFAHRMAALDKASAAAEEEMKKNGATFETVSPEFEADLKAAFAFVEQDWYKSMSELGVDGPAAMKFYRDTIKSEAAGG